MYYLLLYSLITSYKVEGITPSDVDDVEKFAYEATEKALEKVKEDKAKEQNAAKVQKRQFVVE